MNEYSTRVEVIFVSYFPFSHECNNAMIRRWIPKFSYFVSKKLSCITKRKQIDASQT